ncbi:MAG: helix-turn-helix transcriptional regulator, partial [Bacteroidales bacterium]|nr:helix-turn-helix transcriptional regulator [Bacteroidales bacterium]
MKVSENIKKILSDKGFTQAMLAEALGKDNATISRILNETQEL